MRYIFFVVLLMCFTVLSGRAQDRSGASRSIASSNTIDSGTLTAKYKSVKGHYLIKKIMVDGHTCIVSYSYSEDRSGQTATAISCIPRPPEPKKE
jgi:hypothetical protein